MAAHGRVGVGKAAAHQAFHRGQGVERVDGLLGAGCPTDDGFTFAVADHRGQQDVPLGIRQGPGHAAGHGGDEGIGGAEIDPDGQTGW